MHSLRIVQWNFTRRDHPGNPGRVSGSGPVKVVVLTRIASAARYGTFFTYSHSYLNPNYSFIRVPKHRYMNTGLNDAKICKNGAAGKTCTGTPLTCTGTGYPLHNLYRYTLDLYWYR